MTRATHIFIFRKVFKEEHEAEYEEGEKLGYWGREQKEYDS